MEPAVQREAWSFSLADAQSSSAVSPLKGEKIEFSMIGLVA